MKSLQNMVKKKWLRVFLLHLTSCLSWHRLFNHHKPKSTLKAPAQTTMTGCLKIKEDNEGEHISWLRNFFHQSS